jgi:NTE family protein
VVWRPAERTPSPSGPWCHPVDRAEAEAAAGAIAWDRARWPGFDHLVRRLTGREIGLAMSVGAAAGLAHLGVLEVLEADGIPIDYLCGSSMGGALALAYAHHGSAAAAGDAVTRLTADFVRSKGWQWLPRASLVAASRMEAITRALFGDATFAGLRRPAAVVAADLVVGKRVVIDQGHVATAARATAAIPGIFAPVRWGDSLLVDGVVVTRIPADLLAARGCGFKLAVLVRPEGDFDGDPAAGADKLERQLLRPLGLRTALGGSWRLLAWWDSAAQAERADFALSVAARLADGANFAAAPAMIERGRRAALAHLPQIRNAVRQVLTPGVP